MTGPEHYREAERLLEIAATEPETSRLIPYYTAAAQAHATLALAAATALQTAGVPQNGDTSHAWRATICVPKAVR